MPAWAGFSWVLLVAVGDSVSTRSEKGEASQSPGLWLSICLESFFSFPRFSAWPLSCLRCHTSLANIQDRTTLVEKARKLDSQATGKLDSLTLVFPPGAETALWPAGDPVPGARQARWRSASQSSVIDVTAPNLGRRSSATSLSEEPSGWHRYSTPIQAASLQSEPPFPSTRSKNGSFGSTAPSPHTHVARRTDCGVEKCYCKSPASDLAAYLRLIAWKPFGAWVNF